MIAGLYAPWAQAALALSSLPVAGHAALVERIHSAAQQRAATQAGGGQAVDDALASLNAVLSDPNLQRPLATPAPRPTPSQPLPDLQIPRIGLDVIRLMLAIAGGIGVIALIVALGPTLYRIIAARRRNASPDAGTDAEVATSVDAIARAQQASTIQDYRLAMRMLYLACLLKLDESGALRYDRTQTNREYVRQIAGHPALASALQPVVEVFDDVWYGFRVITPQGYAAFESRVRELMDLAVASHRPANP
jgi:hypothetical protein